jgi:outer membrane protein TolC
MVAAFLQGDVEVVDASREALQAERANAQCAGQREIATAQLIKALGGGWREDEVVAKRQGP